MMTVGGEGGGNASASTRRNRPSDELITGRLVAHGAANYHFRRDQDASYFVRLQTQRGERVLWGKDLARAILASTTQVTVGDVVGLRRVGRDAVTVVEQRRDREGRVVAQREQLAHRNHWVIEKAGFFAERARMARRLRDEQLDASAAVREHPELKSTFLTLRAAEEFANQKIASKQDRERFVELVKGAIVGSIHRGEPLPSVRMRNAPEASQRPERVKNDRGPQARTR